MNPYVFFVGSPRSGTTLVQRLADAHPRLAVTHETRWIARWYEKRVGLTPDGYVTPRLLERLPEHARFKALKLDPADVRRVYGELRRVHYADFVAALFDRFAARKGKRLAGDKSPDYVLHVDTLHELWPSARFVHVVRDGRDICLSMLEWQKGAARFGTWREDPVGTIAVWWEWHVRLGRERGRALERGLYHELRYERLVEAPAAECERLCAAMGLAFDEAMLRFNEGRARDDPGLDAKKAWKPVTAGLRAWREQLPRDDLRRFEAAAGDLLEELGYGRVSAPSAAERARAERLRERFADEAEARGRRLPQAWTAGSLA